MFAVLCAVDKPETEEQKYAGKNKSQAKRHTPNTIIDMLMIGCEDDERDDACDYEAKVNCEIGGNGDKDSSLTPDICSFIRCLCRACTTGWIFTYFDVNGLLLEG